MFCVLSAEICLCQGWGKMWILAKVNQQ